MSGGQWTVQSCNHNAVDRFLALSCALIYNEIVTNYRTMIFSVLGKVVLLLVTALVFVLDQEIQDCDKALYSASCFLTLKLLYRILFVNFTFVLFYKVYF